MNDELNAKMQEYKVRKARFHGFGLLEPLNFEPEIEEIK